MVDNFNKTATNSSAGFVRLFLVGFFHTRLGVKYKVSTKDSSIKEETPGDSGSPHPPIGHVIKKDTRWQISI